MRFTTLDQWLAWQETLHPRDIDLGLERTREVAERLDLINTAATVITVAGTNGKGSCVAALEYLLKAQGDSTGAYTSPHLLRYNERIRLNGHEATDEDICRSFDAIDQARGEVTLSYFEFGTLAAMWLFKQSGVSYWLLEVGLGGRLDATNIVDPTVAVVTSVALDHQHFLGDNRESIGWEKAGIFRSGRWAVCADTETPTSVRTHAQALGSHLLVADEDFHWGSTADGQWRLELAAIDERREISLTQPCLPQASMAAALQTLALLGKLPGDSQLRNWLPDVRLAGRFDRRSYRGKTIFLDVAHNPAAAEYLAARLEREGLKHLTAAVGMMADKDIIGSLAPLVPFVDKWIAVGLPDTPRAAPPRAIQETLQSLTVAPDKVFTTRSVANAVDNWVAQPSGQSDTLLVMGSFYTVAAAMHYIDGKAGH